MTHEVDSRIKEWHSMDTEAFVRSGSPSLAGYLGWTDQQYSDWVRDNKFPKEIP